MKRKGLYRQYPFVARMLWIVFLFMSVVAILTVLWPLRASHRFSETTSDARALYQAQLGAIDRDLEQGQVTLADAEIARAQAARRALVLSEQQTHVISRRAATILAVCIVLMLPLGAFLLYVELGRPDMPDLPLASRLADANDVPMVVARIEKHLAEDPRDGKAYLVLAPIYMKLERVPDAINAYQSAMLLLGRSPDLLAGYGEALVAAGHGKVPPLAIAAFTEAVQANPAPPQALFYLAMSASQQGHLQQAIDYLQRILDQSPPNAPWREAVTNKITQLQAQLAADPAAAVIAALPADQQNQQIRSMVDGLAQRLKQNGKDPEGWARLIRSYTVLGEPDLARQAIADARQALAGDSEALSTVNQLGQQLNMTPSTPAAPVAGAQAVQEQAASIAALPAQQQNQAIRSMVDGLAQRLKQNGQDPEAWSKLIRSYMVLGQPDLARQALIDAGKALANDPEGLAKVKALAQQIGLEAP